MSASAVFMMITGILATFLPQEILGVFGSPESDPVVLIIQICGALYLGFAMLNWMAKGNLIGGIYSRPVAMGNFLHFTIVAAALLKLLLKGQQITLVLGGFVLFYLIFAVWFGMILFGNPLRENQ